MDTATPARFATAHTHGRSIVTVAGPIDIANASALQSFLIHACDTAAHTRDGRIGYGDVIVDLSAVTFISAAGLSTLIHADRHARRHGNRLRLAAPCVAVARILALTDLERHLTIHPTIDVATSLHIESGRAASTPTVMV